MTRALRFAVVGDPIAHSKSPAMHGAAYRALALPHTYEAIRTTDAELAEVVAKVRSGELAGVNVTVPHKQRVLALVDDVAPSAAAVGAANVLVRASSGKIVAHNTDVDALVAELGKLAGTRRSPPKWRRSTAIVLGSGGAARAAAGALENGLGVAEVIVRARRPVGSEWTVFASGPSPRAFSGRRVFESFAPTARDRDVLTVVQATSAGMSGADPGDAVADAIAWSDLPNDAIALDLVYAPPETPFLRAARARGLRSANGLGMLIEQGALAFELWLGVEAPRDAMRAALQ